MKEALIFCLMILGISAYSQKGKIYTGLVEALKAPQKVYILNLTKDKEIHYLSDGINYSFQNPISKKFTDLPPEFSKFVNLEKLEMRGDALDSLPSVLLKLKNLKYLDLSCCGLKSLPQNIDCLENLEYLDVSANQLTELPASLGNIKNLRVLDYHSNENLKDLPIELGKLKKLKSISVDTNFDKIPEVVFLLDSLKNITITTHGKLKLGEEFKRLKSVPRLETIRLFLFNTDTLPEELFDITQLKYLHIQFEKQAFISNDIHKMKNLKLLLINVLKGPLYSLKVKNWLHTNLPKTKITMQTND